MKRIIWVFLIVVLGIVLAFSVTTANANGVPVRIKVTDGQLFLDVGSDQTIVLWWRWIACSRGQTIAFVKSLSENEHVLDEIPLFASLPDANQHWGEPEPTTDLAEFCTGNVRTAWEVIWEYELGELEPGFYEIVSTASLAHPIYDGFDINDGFLFSSLNRLQVGSP